MKDFSHQEVMIDLRRRLQRGQEYVDRSSCSRRQ